MRLPYGFDALKLHFDEDPWVNLITINEFLEDQQPIPPDLAQWLGHAIRYADRDPKVFLKRLGLVRSRGKPHQLHAKDAWQEWGEKVWRLEADMGREEALADVARQYAQVHGEEPVRSTLKKWRDTYEEARAGN